MDDQVNGLTSTILSLQELYIPNHTFTVKPLYQPWFGYECRKAANEKSKTWKHYKRHPTHHNKARHKEACDTMRRVQQFAQQRWQEVLSSKLSGRAIGSKSWWATLKEQQGVSPGNHIPPLNKADGSIATRSWEKAEVLASHFSMKMTIPDPGRPSPALPHLTYATIEDIIISREELKRQLQDIDIKKALGPDGVSPHILKNCASQLAAPVTAISACALVNGPPFGKWLEWQPSTKRQRRWSQKITDLCPYYLSLVRFYSL